MILTFAVSGYRSLRDLVVPLGRLTVVTGPNGCGKSSLYRALRLMADVAQGRAIGSLAREGGLRSALWAGPETISRRMRAGAVPVEGTARREKPVAVKLGFADEDYGFAIELGLPTQGKGLRETSAFCDDPDIKAETLWVGEQWRRSHQIAIRRGRAVQVVERNGHREVVLSSLASYDSMMTHAADPRATPEVLQLRERMRAWRFYDHFRTDAEALARRPQVGTRTPVLASTGADLAAALQTIAEVGDTAAVDRAVADAFPGAALEIVVNEGLFEVVMHQRGLLRPLRAAELSDGTLRYLLLIGALMTPRPPPFMVLNEPESSLHPSLLPPLGRLMIEASERCQIVVVSHARALVEALRSHGGSRHIALDKDLGETLIEDVDMPAWSWPAR